MAKRKRGMGKSRKKAPSAKRRRIARAKYRIKRKVKKAIGVGRYNNGFPANKIVRMVYSDRWSIGPGLSEYSYIRINCLNPADPDATTSSTTNQPRGWDQWTPFYDHFIVLGAKITMKVYRQELTDPAPTQVPMIVACYVDDNDTPFDMSNTAGRRDLMEQGSKYKHKIFQPYMKSLTIKNYFSPKKFFGIKNLMDNQTRLGGSTSTTTWSGEDAFWQIQFSNINTGVTLQKYYADIRIDYLVKFSEPKPIAAS